MRFLELSLIAFGPFTDRRLDLRGGREGLHVIYGPNEAGKSSTLRAVSDLLYGIPAQSRDAHRHEPAALRIGAQLRAKDGREIAIIRRKGAKQTLLNPDESPLPDDALAPFLGGVTRELFATMFGLDHERLVAGASSLLAGEGQLGASLYGASLGVSGLHKVLKRLEREADDLFNPRAVKPKINASLKRWQELVKKSRDEALPPQEWERIRRELETLELQREGLAFERQELSVRLGQLTRLRTALPKLAALELLRRELEELGALPELGATAAEDRRAALRERDEARRAIAKHEREIADLAQRHDELPDATGWLQAEGAILSLKERLAAHREVESRLPGLSADLDRTTREIEGLQSSLGADASRVRVDRAQRARLLELLGRSVELGSDLRRLGQARDRAAQELHALDHRLAELSPHLDAFELRAALERGQRDGDLEARERDLADQLAKTERKLKSELSQLERWSGGIDALLGATFPSSDAVEVWRDRFGDLEQRRARLERTRMDLEVRQRAIRADLLEVQLGGELPTDEDLRNARAARDAIGERLRVRVTKPASLFEELDAAIRRADAIVDRLRADAERVSRRSGLEARQRSEEEAAAALVRDEAALLGAEEDARRGWATLWPGLAAPPGTPKEMLSWLRRHAAVVDLAARRSDLEAEVAAIRARISAHDRAVRERLAGIGVTAIAAGWPGAQARARSELDRVESLARTRETLTEQKRIADERLKATEAELALAAGDYHQWRQQFDRLVARLGLEGAREPSEVQAILEGVDALERLRDLRARIDDDLQLQRARLASFEASVREVMEALEARGAGAREARENGAAPVEAPDLAAERLFAELMRAKDATVNRAAIESQLSRARSELADAQEVVSRTERELALMQAAARVDSLEALEIVEQRAERRRRVREEVGVLETQLLELGAGLGVSALAQAAKEIGPERIEVELEAQSQRVIELEREIAALDREIGARRGRRDALDGRDDAARAAEEAEAVAAEIRSHVERYLLVHLAAVMLRRQIDRYREEHAGSLLLRAGDLLARLSGSSLVRLESALDDHSRPILLGVRPSGQRLEVSAMSDGTRDQLYLALRIATIERYLRQSSTEALPLVVDDILLNFDDDRAEVALQILGELSDQLQILFFTHHARLVELAQRAVPAQRLLVHHLGDLSAITHRTALVSGVVEA
ncbi:MAG: AAA family ATPase [Deltaproteobacteria bacterium]|nr:AAA family ATPase [Deltaproteobacteria bacterium]